MTLTKRRIALVALLLLGSACLTNWGDVPLYQLGLTDFLGLDPTNAALSLSKSPVGTSDAGLTRATTAFSVYARKSDGRPAETAHVHIDLGFCSGAQVDVAVNRSVVFVPDSGCAQTSATHLDCVLEADGAAHFAIAAALYASPGLHVPFRACSGGCKPPPDDACVEASLDFVP